MSLTDHVNKDIEEKKKSERPCTIRYVHMYYRTDVCCGGLKVLSVEEK